MCRANPFRGPSASANASTRKGNRKMAGPRRPLVAGNWKMNGLAASIGELDRVIAGAPAVAATADLMVCPPATLVAAFAARAGGGPVAIGGQDCHAEAAGAFTGDI